MTHDELDMFIKNAGTLFKLKLTGDDPRTKAWVDRFKGMDYQLANKVVYEYYQKGNTDKYHDVTPKDVMQVYDQVRRQLGYIVDTDCGYCQGQGMINVKRWIVGLGWHDYGYRCFCSAGKRVYNNFPQLQKTDLEDYEQIQKTPARYCDVHMYKGKNKTSELVSNDMIKQVKPKKYSKEAIERWKEKMKIENSG